MTRRKSKKCPTSPERSPADDESPDVALIELNLDDDNLPILDRIDEIVPIGRMIALRKRKLSYSEIGAIVGCTKQNVQQRLQPFVQRVDHLQEIRDAKIDQMVIVESMMLDELTIRNYKGESLRDIAVSHGIMVDKRRLEEDKSTSNVAVYAVWSESMTELNTKLATNEAELGLTGIEDQVDEDGPIGGE